MEADMARPRHAAHVSTGLVIIRLALGAILIYHGYDKLVGGVSSWEQVGGMGMGAVGLANLYPVVWGFLAMVAEFFGGIATVLGVLFRPFQFLILVTLVLASAFVVQNRGWMDARLPMVLAAVSLGLLFTGAGRYALGRCIPGLRGRWCA
jgi:putative oxidoreductase